MAEKPVNSSKKLSSFTKFTSYTAHPFHLAIPQYRFSNIRHTSLAKEPAGNASCLSSKTIELTFHRTSPDIIMLAVTTDLASLSAKHPGWRVNPSSLTCSGINICCEQCNLKLTYTPTKDRPESTIYLSYEYQVNGQKQLKKNQGSIVYNPTSPLFSSGEIT